MMPSSTDLTKNNKNRKQDISPRYRGQQVREVYKDFFILGNKRTQEKRSSEGARGGHNPPGRAWLAPWCLVPTRVHFLVVSYFPNFCYIPKLTKNIFVDFLESVYLPYHVPPIFSRFWSGAEGLFYVFFRCESLDNITFNINGHT